MESITKTQDFGPTPITQAALEAFYLGALTEIQERYNKLPQFTELEIKLKTSSGDVRAEIPFVLSATEVTTLEQRKTMFVNLFLALSEEPQIRGLSMEVEAIFKVPVSE